MGTTLTAMLFSGSRAALTHIGDSRAFRLCGGQLRPITKDHAIGKPRHRRRLTRADAPTAPGRQGGPFG
jgi:serine/threonine protein phosphatase PrpC